MLFYAKTFPGQGGALQQHFLEHFDKVHLVLLMFQTNKVSSSEKLSALRIILYGSFSMTGPMATWRPIKILEFYFYAFVPAEMLQLVL